MSLLWWRVNVKIFGFSKFLQDFEVMKNAVLTAIHVCIYILFSPVIWKNIHRCLNNIFRELKVLMKVIKTEMFRVNFSS